MQEYVNKSDINNEMDHFYKQKLSQFNQNQEALILNIKLPKKHKIFHLE